MATVNVVLLVFVLCVLVLMTTANMRNDVQKLRPRRGFKEYDLATTRGFGKRTDDMPITNKLKSPPDIEWSARQQRGLHEMNIPVARGFGKRTMDMHRFNNFLLDWLAFQTKLRNIRMAQEDNNIQEEEAEQ